VTAGNAAERSEHSTPIAWGDGAAAALIAQAAAAGVRLEARPGGRLWADRPTLLPGKVRAGLALRRAAVLALLDGDWGAPDVPAPMQLPGVPPDRRDGVALLANLQAPPTIPPRRWAVLAATSARLLRDHGAALHGAGWDALHLFGLDATAPATNPPGWGLAWLLGEHGEVLDVAPEAVGMRQGRGGARLAYRRPGASARAEVVPAWAL